MTSFGCKSRRLDKIASGALVAKTAFFPFLAVMMDSEELPVPTPSPDYVLAQAYAFAAEQHVQDYWANRPFINILIQTALVLAENGASQHAMVAAIVRRTLKDLRWVPSAPREQNA
jgi:(p)ppGpp synthase/HD superfamily hydrolase